MVTLPAPLDFLTVGELGGKVTFDMKKMWPPTAFGLAGKICLDKPGRGPCNKDTAIQAQLAFGLDNKDPEANFIYFFIKSISFGKLLGLFIPKDKMAPFIILDPIELDAKFTYSLNGIDPEDPFVEGLGIEVPEGFHLDAKAKFMGVDVAIKASMDSHYLEASLEMSPIKIGGLIQITRSKTDTKNGMFVQVYAGWAADFIFGNDDWCGGPFCMSGAGYMSILGGSIAEGWFTFTADGPKTKYVMENVAVLGGAFQGDLVVEQTQDILNPLDTRLFIAARIETNGILLKVAKVFMKMLKAVYDLLMKAVDGLLGLVKKAEAFVGNVVKAVTDPLRKASDALENLYFKMRSPFDAAAREVNKIRGCKCSFALNNIPTKDHGLFLMMIEDFERREGEDKHFRHGGAPEGVARSMFMTREDANTFLSVREGTGKFGFVGEAIEKGIEIIEDGKEWLVEKGREAIELAKEAVERVKEAALSLACLASNVGLKIAFLALKPFQLLYMGLGKFHWLLNQIPKTIIREVMMVLETVETTIKAMFGWAVKAFENGSFKEFAEALNNIFSIKELSGSLELSVSTQKVTFKIIAVVAGQLIDFGFKYDGLPSLISTIITKILGLVVPGMEEAKEKIEMMMQAIGGTFEAAIKGAKETVGSVKSFIEDIEAII